MSPLPSSDFEDINALAACEFEPWKQREGSWKPPSNEEWTRLANPHLVSVRLAWVTLHKSKEELVAVAGELGDEGLMQLVGQIGQSSDWFKGLKQVLEAAECRLMCALAARALNDQRD